ncbi:MAG: carboxylating nicotinate-nucleotide diphosphorylase [Gammaproteobacteria bacterium]|nr:carboxylating nicotinate-nucleotide diphosphorylase [Gammaproteobacteria bacterium]
MPELPSAHIIVSQIREALTEDLGPGDLTASLIDASEISKVEVTCRERAILCGVAWFDEVFRQLDPGVEIAWHGHDGDPVEPGQLVCSLEGNTRALLSGERTALNYLQTLSGTATRARSYADKVSGTTAKVLDTRKTLPGLRVQQKYAVSCGGCVNHRMGLYDAILIKENHILAAGSIAAALAAAQALLPKVDCIEIEVESLVELQEALNAGAKRVLLDNFSLDQLREAVRRNAGKALLEASGGIDLETIRSVAETGVDYISVGNLTKDVTAIDLSMRFV